MAFLGTAFTKFMIPKRTIDVFLLIDGPTYMRLVAVAREEGETAALNKTKAAFEAEQLFDAEIKAKTEKLMITNLWHTSAGDDKTHYSCSAHDANDNEIKGGHVQEDESKQTVEELALAFSWSSVSY